MSCKIYIKDIFRADHLKIKGWGLAFKSVAERIKSFYLFIICLICIHGIYEARQWIPVFLLTIKNCYPSFIFILTLLVKKILLLHKKQAPSLPDYSTHEMVSDLVHKLHTVCLCLYNRYIVVSIETWAYFNILVEFKFILIYKQTM